MTKRKGRMRAAALFITAAMKLGAVEEPAVTPDMETQLRTMILPRLEALPPGSTISVPYCYNEAKGVAGDEFAAKVIADVIKVAQENHNITLVDGARVRAELGNFSISALFDKEKAVQAAPQLAGAVDVFLSIRVHNGMFVVILDDGVQPENINLLFDKDYFKLYSGKELPPAPRDPVALRFSADLVDACWSPDERKIIVLDSAAVVRAVDARPPYETLWKETYGQPIYGLGAAGTEVIAATNTGLLFIDGENGNVLREAPLGPVYSLVPGPDGTIYAGTAKGVLAVDYLSGKFRPIGSGVDTKITNMVLREAGLVVQTGAGIRTLNLEKKEFGPLINTKDFFVLQDRVLVSKPKSNSKDRKAAVEIKAYRLSDGKEIAMPAIGINPVAVSSTPFQNYIYIAAENEAIFCLEATTCTRVSVINSSEVNFIRPSPRGSRFLSASFDQLNIHDMARDLYGALVIENTLPTEVRLSTNRRDLPVFTVNPKSEYRVELGITEPFSVTVSETEAFLGSVPHKSQSVILSDLKPTVLRIIPDNRPAAVLSPRRMISPVSLAGSRNGLLVCYLAPRLQSGGRPGFAQLLGRDGGISALKADGGPAHTQAIVSGAVAGNWAATASVDDVKVWNRGRLVTTFAVTGTKRVDVNSSGAVLASTDKSVALLSPKSWEIAGSCGVFLGENRIALIPPGGKQIAVVDMSGAVLAEYFTGREYPLVLMNYENGYYALVYRDNFTEARNAADFSIVPGTGRRGSACSIGGNTFVVIDRENIVVKNLSNNQEVRIPWKAPRAALANDAGTQILVADNAKLSCVDPDGTILWQHAVFEDLNDATVAGRYFRGSPFHIELEKNGVRTPYTETEDTRGLLNEGAVKSALSSFWEHKNQPGS